MPREESSNPFIAQGFAYDEAVKQTALSISQRFKQRQRASTPEYELDFILGGIGGLLPGVITGFII